jgi:hypothetical protein
MGALGKRTEINSIDSNTSGWREALRRERGRVGASAGQGRRGGRGLSLEHFLGRGEKEARDSRERADLRAVSRFVSDHLVGAPSCPYAISTRHGKLPFVPFFAPPRAVKANKSGLLQRVRYAGWRSATRTIRAVILSGPPRSFARAIKRSTHSSGLYSSNMERISSL